MGSVAPPHGGGGDAGGGGASGEDSLPFIPVSQRWRSLTARSAGTAKGGSQSIPVLCSQGSVVQHRAWEPRHPQPQLPPGVGWCWRLVLQPSTSRGRGSTSRGHGEGLGTECV